MSKMVFPNCEAEPLLQTGVKDSPTTQTSENRDRWSRLRGWFLVEPILILEIIGTFPLNTITQKYVIEWITNESLDTFAGQNLVYHQTNKTFEPCHSNKSDPDYQFQQYVQGRSSQLALYASIIQGIPAVFVTIFLGVGSDVFGRRFAILPPLVGTLLGSAIVTYVVITKASIYWLFLRSALNGCCGTFLSAIMGCLAYLTDRTPPEKRMIRITIMEISLFISGIISPIVLGKATTMFGYFGPLLFTVATSAVNLSYVLLFMPKDTKQSKDLFKDESVTQCPSSTYRSKCLTILVLLRARVRSMVSLFAEKSATTSVVVRWSQLKLNLLIVAYLFITLPASDASLSTLFMMNSPLCWDIDTIGLFSGVSSGVTCAAAMIAAPLFKRFGMPDYAIVILASFAFTATSFYKAFVQTTVMMFLSIGLSMFGFLFMPSMRSLVSSQVSDDQQGAIFGAMASLDIICSVIGTTIFNSIYSATLYISTGFVFIVMVAFYAVGNVLICAHAVMTRLDARKESAMYAKIDEMDGAKSDRLESTAVK